MPTVLTASHGVPLPSMSSSSFSSSPSLLSMLSPSSLSSSLLSSSSPGPSSLPPPLASIRHLLSRALSLPCSTAAQAFTQLVQPTMRFQVALDALLPLLDGDLSTSSSTNDVNATTSVDSNNQVAQRILVSFILFSLYAPHPISINPFKSALLMTFANERERAIRAANYHADANSMTGAAGTSPSEQLVWVLWKILRGDGNDIGPYTPSTLARSPLPPKLAAINLILDETDDNDLDNYYAFASEAGSGASIETSKYPDANVITKPSRATTLISSSEDLENAVMSRGLALLLAARERVLSLSERRSLEPIFSALAASEIITPYDLSSIVTLNPDVAYPLFVELLTASVSSSSFLDVLDILVYLPPSLSTFDLMGKLLRDNRLIPIPNAIPHLFFIDGHDYSNPESGIPLGRLIRYQVLARFMHECIERLEKEERERTSLEGPGGISDGNDAWGRGVRNLCRFYLSLIKLNIVQNPQETSAFSRHSLDWGNNNEPESFAADSVEISHFALRNSRFEEARMLYGVLATGGLDV